MFLKKWLAYKRESPIIGDNKPKLKASAEYGGRGERELQLRLEIILDKLAEGRRDIYTAAKELAAYSLAEQERFLHAAENWQKQSPELAYQFCRHGLVALRQLSGRAWDDWLAWLSQCLRQQGSRAAIARMRDFEAYLASNKRTPQTVMLEDLMPVLSGLLTALGGRKLQIKSGDVIYTDTANVYLPASYGLLPSYEENCGFYKLATVFAWAQTWFSTWQTDLQPLLYDLDNQDRAWLLFQALEGLRLDACLERSLPGIARLGKQLGRQRERLPEHELWRRAAEQLERQEARAQDSAAWVRKLLPVGAVSLPSYQGRFKPLDVRRVLNARAAQEEKKLQITLQGIAEKQSAGRPTPRHKKQTRFSIKMDRGNPYSAEKIELNLDGEPLELTPELEKLLRSIAQDWDGIPDEWLKSTAGEGENGESGQEKAGRSPSDAVKSAASEIYMPEWDHSINSYRPRWCRIFLRPAETTGDGLGRPFSLEVKNRHYGVIKRLRNGFEFLRESDMRVRRQADGDEIDLDAAVNSVVAVRCGEEPDSKIYIHNRTKGRNVAVVFMVDMSASTRGRTSQIEKEALILLCESLSSLRDRYALYGFSSHTRAQCNIYCIKSFDEAYSQTVQDRIAAIRPHHYTRMGAAIRYLRRCLLGSEAKTRLLLSLSDGRPEDKDGYRGNYGIEDTRRALLETAHAGIHSHCITIDEQAMDYLPYMYGSAHVSIVNDVETLPFRMADIYRRITQ